RLGQKVLRVDMFERGRAIPQVDVVRKRARAETVAVLAGADVDETLGAGDRRRRPEEDGVRNGEHRRVGAKPDRKGQPGSQGTHGGSADTGGPAGESVWGSGGPASRRRATIDEAGV